MPISSRLASQKAAVKAAFPHTIPVMAGYLFLGAAFGMLLRDKGYGPLWALMMSVGIYAGSMQFVAAGLMAGGFNPMTAFVLTLMVNARHLFYGLSMLEPFEGMGRIKPYMIFSLTDETYALFAGMDPPDTGERRQIYFWITFLNQCYWVTGSLAGSLMGQWLAFDFAGIGFAMTALFVVIFLEQWLNAHKEEARRGFLKAHAPAMLGAGISALCLILVGKSQFLLPAMAGILLLFTALRGRLDEGVGENERI